jgi:hypothetical protein
MGSIYVNVMINLKVINVLNCHFIDNDLYFTLLLLYYP